MSDRHTAGPTEAEKDAFFAQIAADEKRKLDAHDDLVSALREAIEDIEALSGRDNSCDPKIDCAEYKAVIRKATGEQQ